MIALAVILTIGLAVVLFALLTRSQPHCPECAARRTTIYDQTVAAHGLDPLRADP